MRILYMSPNGYLGGAENVVLNLCLEHQKNNIEYMLVFFNEGKAIEKAKTLNLNYIVLKNKFRLSRPLKLSLAILELRKMIKEYKATHLHGTMPYSYIVGFFATMFMPIKRIWFQHGPVGNIFDKIAVHLPVDLIFFNSAYLKKSHHQIFSLWNFKHQEKIIHLGVEAKLTHTLHENLKNQDEFLCLLVGRVSPIKGQDIAIKALSHLRLFKNKVKLLVIGDMGGDLHRDYKTHLLHLVSSLGLEDKVIFVGEKSNVQDYYSLADLTLMTTNIPEAFGMVIAESMIYSTLVLGNNQGGAADLLVDQKTGFTYNTELADSSVELARKLENVLQIIKNEPDKVLEIKKNAFNLISKNYSMMKFHQEVLDAYKTL